MTESEWSVSTRSQYYTADEVNSFSKDVAYRLEHQGGKEIKSQTKKESKAPKEKKEPKPRGFQAKTKVQLLELAKERKIKVSSNFTKDKIIEALRKKK